MADALSPSSKKSKKGVVASVWLIMALLSGVATLALWMFTSAPVFETKKEEANQPSQEEVAFNIGQITHIDSLGELNENVNPISFDPLVKDLRDHPPEFKDSNYLRKNKNKWTVQVMDVSKHSLINEYLNGRKDRDDFAYFRYRDKNNSARYVLTYGVVKSSKEVEKLVKKIDFGLPGNVELMPKKLGDYIDVIEKYELTPPVKDLATNRTRQVKLKPTRKEIEAIRKANNEELRRETAEREQAERLNNIDEPQEQGIKGSENADDTLFIQERRVTRGGQNNPNQSPPTPSNDTPAPSEPSQQQSPQPKPKPQPQQQAPKENIDDIQRLIDEKTN